MTSEKFAGLFPVDITRCPPPAVVSWLDFRGADLTEPFFHQTVDRILRSRSDAGLVKSDLNELIGFENQVNSLQPALFIFHLSRCGSTLISNALKSIRNAIVISEPQAINEILTPFSPQCSAYSREEWNDYLPRLMRGVVSALGQIRKLDQQYYFLKFTSWNVLHLSLVRSLWPAVPCLFVYRNPVEVMVSVISNNTRWMKYRSRPEFAELLPDCQRDEIAQMSPEDFCARVLGRFCDTVIGAAAERVFLLNYREINPEMLLTLLRRINCRLTGEETQAMSRIMKVYSKNTRQTKTFAYDSDVKRRSASAGIHSAAERWAMNSYSELEELSLRSGRV
jgi:hypothetical protein